ncbi:MAG: cupin domain-containing protein [Armatimonadota bacterium]
MPLRNIYEMPSKENQVRGGDGTCNEAAAFTRDELKTKLLGIGMTTLHPGSSVGVHPHEDNEEVYLILSGQGIATIDGREQRVRPGDVMVNHPGCSHGLKNDSDEELRIFAFAVATG